MEDIKDTEDVVNTVEQRFVGYLGCQVERHADGKVTATLEIRQQHLNKMGNVHGGVLAAILDIVMGATAHHTRRDNTIVTTNLNVHYLSPPRGDKLFATGEIIHQSSKTLTIQGTITSENGKISAHGTGSFRVIS